MQAVRANALANGIPVGRGDRHAGGTVSPRGVGSSTATIKDIMNVHEIQSGLKALAKVYNIKTFETPYRTFEGNAITGGAIGGTASCNQAYRVYLNGGTHARERGSPDGVLYFISDLLWADRNNVGLTYGTKAYTAEDVKTAMSVGVVFIPNVNPDGVAYDQQTNSCWRKNRFTKSGDAGIGVDVNRNFDFLWDFPAKFAPSVASRVASTNPSAETYHGTAAFSEAESKSMKWVMDEFSRVRYFVDLHSYTGDVLHSWGSDENQSRFPNMNFLNSQYDGVRGITSDDPGSGNAYGEYVPEAEGLINVGAAERMAKAMTASTNRGYEAVPSANLYPTSGSSDDYAYSRHFANTTLNLIHGYTIEFGFGNAAANCPFYPSEQQHNNNMKEVGAAFMELLLAAKSYGLGPEPSC